MSTFDDASWKVNAINYMAQNRVFRSGAIVEIGANSGVSKRSVDYLISDLIDENRIFPAQRGLYFIVHQEKPVSPVEIARAINPGVAVSMESSFRTPSITGREDLMSHLVVTEGRTGQFKSPLGAYSIHRVSHKLTLELEQKLGTDVVYQADPFPHSQIPVVTPTIAYLHICSGNALSRRGQSYGNDLPDSFLDQVDIRTLVAGAEVAGISLPNKNRLQLSEEVPSPGF